MATSRIYSRKISSIFYVKAFYDVNTFTVKVCVSVFVCVCVWVLVCRMILHYVMFIFALQSKQLN